MIRLLNKLLHLNLRFFYPIIILVFLIEIFFQIIFLFDIKSLKKTILFFNPFCDQVYWNYEGNSSYDKNYYTYHPFLTIIKKDNEKYFYKDNSQNLASQKNKLVFYGSSFIDHEYFKKNNTNNINFAIKSYGIDQIYKSYMMTKENFPNKDIIIGFLLEDIDRAIFTQRNFPKLKYKEINGKYEITNVPILFKDDFEKNLSFYTFKFLKNLIFLSLNNYNYNYHECEIKNKKLLFEYFVDDIIKNSIILNQNILFVTFNFRNNIDDPNWRYSYVNEYFLSKNLNHLDTTKVIKDDLLNNKKLSVIDYYNQKDFHLNAYGFDLISKNIKLFIEQYK